MKAVILLFALFVQDEHPGKFDWAKDMESAKAQSKKDGRPIITYWTFEA